MRKLGLAAAVVTGVMVGTACSDSLAPEAIAGSYAVSVWELTSVATPSTQEEWIAGGVTISFVIGADGSFAVTATWDETATVDPSGGLNWEFSGVTLSGTIAIDGSTVTISLPDPCSGPISRSGDTLTWTLPECVMRDFGDGEELATLRVVAKRTE